MFSLIYTRPLFKKINTKLKQQNTEILNRLCHQEVDRFARIKDFRGFIRSGNHTKFKIERINNIRTSCRFELNPWID